MKISVLDRDSLGKDLPLDKLNQFGEVVVFPSTANDEVISHISNSEVILINKVKITEEIMRSCENLRLICIFATGYDNVDVVSAKKLGIAVCNVPGYSTDSVALCTIATVLSLVTHLKEYNRYVTDGSYSASGVPNKLDPVYHELTGKTWGIIGAGNIGKSVARVAEALGARVIVNKRVAVPELNCVSIDTIAKDSDIITIHCPLNDGTRGLINEKLISLMKKDVIIVNEARGAVVVDEDVVSAIKEGKIAGYGSDVYNVEPFGKDHPFYEIMSYDNVLLTPHFAWGAYESRLRCLNIVCENIKAFISDEKLNRVD